MPLYVHVYTVKVLSESASPPDIGPVTDYVAEGTPLLKPIPELFDMEPVSEEGIEVTDDEAVEIRRKLYAKK